jgi:threonine/homoserine/homoserine lactone efflux protein
MVLAALGVSAVSPTGTILRLLEVVGGGFLLWIAVDGLRVTPEAVADRPPTHVAPEVRGSLAIILNPGGWLFLATVASPLLGAATTDGGSMLAIAAALALVAGAALGDIGIVLAGGLGLRRARAGVITAVRRALAIVLLAFGVWLIVRGAIG